MVFKKTIENFFQSLILFSHLQFESLGFQFRVLVHKFRYCHVTSSHSHLQLTIYDSCTQHFCAKQILSQSNSFYRNSEVVLFGKLLKELVYVVFISISNVKYPLELLVKLHLLVKVLLRNILQLKGLHVSISRFILCGLMLKFNNGLI